MVIDFNHKMSAHCENGVTRNLLNYYDVEISEALVFGIGSGLFFTFFPFIKLNGSPVVSFRPLPGVIFKRVTKALNIDIKIKKYKNKPNKSMSDLDLNLQKNIPTGMVVGVFYLSYFPVAYRFHFNAHNIVVFGKEGDDYIVSDPIMQNVEKISSKELLRVRYSQGTLKPNGKMYYVATKPDKVDIKQAIKRGIKKTCKQMVVYKGGIIGVKGMRLLAKHILKWDKKLSAEQAKKNVCSLVRMQEEIGTGGAGFRYLYAAFLQESGKILENPELNVFSKRMTEIGDKWRQFAVDSARVCKSRQKEGETFKSISNLLIEISKLEEAFFKDLLKLSL